MNTNTEIASRIHTNSEFDLKTSCLFVSLRGPSWKNLFFEQNVFLGIVLFALISALGAACKQASPERVEILVAAASSLQQPLVEVALEFQKRNSDIDVKLTFGSSGTLLQQALNGAPIDVYLSASERHMDTLRSAQLLIPGHPKTLFGNTLVLVQRPDRPPVRSLQELASDRITRVAMGEPRSVPAGMYAEQSLISVGINDSLSGRKVFAKDVRQVMTYVESGVVDAGFVYASDARSSANARIAFVVEESLHEPILYEGAVLQSSSHAQEGKAFVAFLSSEPARAIFERLGFTLLP